jgi:micrococcal nuclease
MPIPYIYLATVLSVYDGDTIRVDLDMGVYVHKTPISCRLAGIDTPEVRTKIAAEKEAGYRARDWLREMILGKTILLHSMAKPDKYGRLLCRIWCEETAGEKCINDMLIELGHALPYDGGTKPDWGWE